MVLTMKLYFSFVLFAVLLFCSINVEARESKFFSKFTHYTILKHKKHSHSIDALAPSPSPVGGSSFNVPTGAPVSAPAPIEDESQNGYGLYGKDSSQFSTTTTTTTSTIGENELTGERLSAENYKTYFQNDNKNDDDNDGYNTRDTNNYNNNVYGSNYNENGYNNNGYTTRSYNNYHNNNGFTGYKSTENEGMSDTRFLENGKYYYNNDVKKNESPIEYESTVKSNTNYNNGGYYYNGNTEKFSNNYIEEDYPEEYLP